MRNMRQAPRKKLKPQSKNCDIHSDFSDRETRRTCPLLPLSPYFHSPTLPLRQEMKPNYRCCASCRKIAPKEAFWRVVRVYPSHQVQLDRGLGRSAYLCRASQCLKAAQKKNRLGRSLKAPVSDELYQTLWQRLATSDLTSDCGSTGRKSDNSSDSTV